MDKLTAMRAFAKLARRGAPGHPNELTDHACLGYANSGPLWSFEGPGGRAEVRVLTEARADNGDFLRVLALRGHGSAVLPSFLVHRDLAAGALIELLPDYRLGEVGIHAVYSSRKYLPAKVRTLVDFLAERFATRPQW